MIDFREKANKLTRELQAIDFDRLPISDYNKTYIRQLLPVMPYYMRIYTRCLQQTVKAADCPVEEITMVDYGGGSGFLSMLANMSGIGKVIYIDINPHSAETITVLKALTGYGPDVILTGDSSDLLSWCKENVMLPQLLIATDVIEHMYDLSLFFDDLIRANPEMDMLFTTASTPYNPYVKRKLRRFMVDCERGDIVTPNYLTKRMTFIQENYPELDLEQIMTWAVSTRGLIYPDIRKAVANGQLPKNVDKYNTCDPETGNWAERILPINDYAAIISPYGYTLKSGKGFYNDKRGNMLTALAMKLLNVLITVTGKWGFYLAPFITLSMTKTGENHTP